MTQRRRVGIDGRTLWVSNLEKVLWPTEGYTKADLISYLLEAAPFILPHLAHRPLVLTRYPDGIDGKSFYQKNMPEKHPAWLATFAHKGGDGRTLLYCVCRDRPTLAWLGNLAAIELHPWLSRVAAPDRPDFAVFDLDPSPPSTFADVRRVALVLRELLQELGLRGYPKTTGATGLHVYVPIKAQYTYRQVREFVRTCSETVRRVLPEACTLERAVARRRGVYLDYLQNVQGKTLACVYGPRPRPGAPVSLPVTWDELPSLDPTGFNLNTALDRVARVGELFAAVLADRQELPSRLLSPLS